MLLTNDLDEYKHMRSTLVRPFRCTAKDGPFCSPMEKYYTHSRLLYTAITIDDDEEADETRSENLIQL